MCSDFCVLNLEHLEFALCGNLADIFNVYLSSLLKFIYMLCM